MPKVKPPLDMSKVSTVKSKEPLPPRVSAFVRQPNPFDDQFSKLEYDAEGLSAVHKTLIPGVKAGALGPWADALRSAARHVRKGLDIRFADGEITWQARPVRPKAPKGAETPTQGEQS